MRFATIAIRAPGSTVFGMRLGAALGYDDLFRNLGLSVAGNLAGGLGLVTFARFAQAFGSTRPRT